jgi:hypothetical protein
MWRTDRPRFVLRPNSAVGPAMEPSLNQTSNVARRRGAHSTLRPTVAEQEQHHQRMVTTAKSNALIRVYLDGAPGGRFSGRGRKSAMLRPSRPRANTGRTWQDAHTKRRRKRIPTSFR